MPDPFLPAYADSFTTFRTHCATSITGSGASSTLGTLFGAAAPPPLRHSLSTYANDGSGVKTEMDGAAASPFSATPSPLVSHEAVMTPLTINAASAGNGTPGALFGSGPPSHPLSGSAPGGVLGGASSSTAGAGCHPADPAMPTLSPHPPLLKKEADLVATRYHTFLSSS